MHELTYTVRIGTIISVDQAKNISNLGVFVVAKDSRMGICKICKDKVPRRGKTTKSFTTKNLVNHLKAKDV